MSNENAKRTRRDALAALLNASGATFRDGFGRDVYTGELARDNERRMLNALRDSGFKLVPISED